MQTNGQQDKKCNELQHRFNKAVLKGKFYRDKLKGLMVNDGMELDTNVVLQDLDIKKSETQLKVPSEDKEGKHTANKEQTNMKAAALCGR